MYDCQICFHANSSKRVTCRVCGSIPGDYSITGNPVRYALDGTIVQIVRAHGARSVEQTVRHSRVYFRTVKADYYATE